MRFINISGLLLAIAFGSISFTACDSTENTAPLPQQNTDPSKPMPDKPTGEDQSAAPEDLPMSPVQGQVSREIPLQFGNLDIDKDGYINQNEASSVPPLKQQWSELDQNNDGQLETAEFARFDENAREKTGHP